MLVLDAHTCDCVLPRCKNSKHSSDSFWGKCSMIVPLFFTALAYWSEEFLGYLSHINASPTVPPILFYMCGSRECSFFRKTFPWQLLSPYVLSDFYVVKLSCWNIYVGRRPYENFSARKFFRRKFHIMKIFRFTVLTLLTFLLSMRLSTLGISKFSVLNIWNNANWQQLSSSLVPRPYLARISLPV